jgi:protein-disulfide isomerase
MSAGGVRRRQSRLPRASVVALGAACVALSIGCGAAEDIEDIKATQRQILERLAALEKNDKALLASLRTGQLRWGADPDRTHDIEVGTSPTKGPTAAPVTVVAFSDFQCPFCASSVALIEQVLTAYPDEVNYVYKQFPLSQLHKDAWNAAKAALAAHRQGKFWEMHDLLFTNHRALDHESLKGYARAIGLDVGRFEQDMTSAEIEAEVRADIAAGKSVQVTGTPTFFVNGKRVMTRSLETFAAMIDTALQASNDPS